MVEFDWQGMTSYECSVVTLGKDGTIVLLFIHSFGAQCSCKVVF